MNTLYIVIYVLLEMSVCWLIEWFVCACVGRLARRRLVGPLVGLSLFS